MLEVLPASWDDRATAADSPSFVGLPDAGLHDFYLECRRRERVAAAEGAAALAEIDRRRSFTGECYLSPVAFVAHRTGDSHQAAAGRLRMARALGSMPHTTAAFTAGDIDSVRVRRLIDAHNDAPAEFTNAEDDLVERARTQDAAAFTQTVAIWRQNQAHQRARLGERRQFQRRQLTITDTFEGMIHLDADLDPVTGETVITAIGTLAGPANRDDNDGRTATQRRADALGEICRRYLDTGHTPISGGQRPHLNVTVDLDGLTGGPVTRSQIGHNRTLGPAAREFLACDATVCGVLITRHREVLQMGRKTRTATPAQLRALAIRDGGCIVPGCGRPPDWCDAHHLIPWSKGGATNTEDMRLLCRPHHLMLHLGALQLPQRE
jgi:hypothetical protein